MAEFRRLELHNTTTRPQATTMTSARLALTMDALFRGRLSAVSRLNSLLKVSPETAAGAKSKLAVGRINLTGLSLRWRVRRKEELSNNLRRRAGRRRVRHRIAETATGETATQSRL
jgi:hypothetical protein